MTTPTIYDVIQGSDEWRALRCGIITSSIVADLITPTGKVANNNTSRAALADLLAQRIMGRADDDYVSFDMQRGIEDEPIARALYAERYAPVREVGFVTREVAPGVVLGCSPDGFVGDDGGIEIKSRKQKIQIGTILSGCVPSENIMQIQVNMLVTGRKWWNYVSYSAGMPLVVIRCEAEEILHDQIINAVKAAESELTMMRVSYELACIERNWRVTERRATEIEI